LRDKVARVTSVWRTTEKLQLFYERAKQVTRCVGSDHSSTVQTMLAGVFITHLLAYLPIPDAFNNATWAAPGDACMATTWPGEGGF